MKIPKKIYTSESCIEYLRKRNILDAFRKSCQLLLGGQLLGGTQLRIREPKKDDIRYFRINKKYRALGQFNTNGEFIVTTILDHQ